MKCKIFTAVVLAVGMSTGCVLHGFTGDITVKLDEERISFDVQPVISNGRTLVPMRAIFEKLGADVSWDGDTGTITATNGDDVIKLKVDDKELIKNGESITLDVAPKVEEDRTLVPVRAVSESFGCSVIWDGDNRTVYISTAGSVPEMDIPAFSGYAYVTVNGNEPYFTSDDYTTESFERYSALDGAGRCGTAYACVGRDLMPTEKRGNISSVKPTGWMKSDYDFIDGESLYNRCHLIGYQLTGENANERNLITGTRYMNTQGMLPFEEEVAEYVKSTDNHVLYRVTPVFEGGNDICEGVLMEAESVEDEGAGVSFNVFCYNVQPGVFINYETGKNREAEVFITPLEGTLDTGASGVSASDSETTYVLNTLRHKFHRPDCSSVSKMSEKNKQEYYGTRESLIEEGYKPCGECDP